MENKINIAELLKDCPQGMELDCTMYDNITFWGISKESATPINIRRKDGIIYPLTKYGQINNYKDAKCIIFPKGKTTWEGFVPPYQFKDGDVLAASECLVLFKKLDGLNIKCYCTYCFMNNPSFHVDTLQNKNAFHPATEEEKAKLFDAIKENGYKWNPETKTLEKLTEPKFKVGDEIVKKNSITNSYIVSSVSCDYYGLKLPNNTGVGVLKVDEQDEWELVPNKFDITTLKPYDKVLYRMHDKDTWCNSFYCFYKSNHHFVTSLTIVRQCIPYEGNEHLLNTTNDCDDFYKTWGNSYGSNR